jgi:hypothetical protein
MQPTLLFRRGLWQDRKSASPSRTVDREVPPIEREDTCEIFAFGDRTNAASARSIGRSRYFSINSRMRGASPSSSGANVSAPVSTRLQSAF